MYVLTLMHIYDNPTKSLQFTGLAIKRPAFLQRCALMTVASSQLHTIRLMNTNEPNHIVTYRLVCAPYKASDQPVHTLSLIRVFARRSMSSQALNKAS